MAAVVWLLARPASLAAQGPLDPHAVQPERPTVATHAGTVARGWIEMEVGAEFDHYHDRSRGENIPIVAKIGLAPRLQLSVFGAAVRPPGRERTGTGDIGFGVKWRLFDTAPLLGRFAILPSLKVPSGSAASGTGTGTTDAGLLLISSRSLGPIALDINVGYTRRSGSGAIAPRNATAWTISSGGPATGPLGWTAELYGYPPTAGPAGAEAIVAMLVGPTLQVRSWLVFDAGAIVPVTGPQPRALYFGGVYNLGRVWR